MFHPTLLADGLSGRNRQSRFRRRARGRGRHGTHRLTFAAEVLRLEERCMLSGTNSSGASAGPVIQAAALPPGPAWTLMPTPNSQGDENAVMHVTTLQKAITITNNTNTDPTPRWIYPILRATNENSYAGGPYDTNDPALKEYRIYVGYTATDGHTYAGLPPGATITFNIPEALWDGGTMQLVTDTPETEQKFWSSGNPFNYDSSSAATTYLQTLSNDGALLLYRGPTPAGIADAAAAQLTEFTIRDASQSQQGKPMLDTSVDVDISYLNAMYLPVAMEAVLQPGVPEAGYIGTTSSVANFGKRPWPSLWPEPI